MRSIVVTGTSIKCIQKLFFHVNVSLVTSKNLYKSRIPDGCLIKNSNLIKINLIKYFHLFISNINKSFYSNLFYF